MKTYQGWRSLKMVAGLVCVACSALVGVDALAQEKVDARHDAAGRPQIDPRQILSRVRLSQVGRQQSLSGELRQGAAKVGFRMTLDGERIRYDFANAPTLVLTLGERGESFQAYSPEDKQMRNVSHSYLSQNVPGTDISFEDLSLSFLYWPVVHLVDVEKRLTRNCWVVEAEPGNLPSQYGKVKLWVEQQSGALLAAEAYGRTGKLARRFSVRSVQKIGEAYYLKQMRIEAPALGDKKDRLPTYLEISQVQAVKGN